MIISRFSGIFSFALLARIPVGKSLVSANLQPDTKLWRAHYFHSVFPKISHISHKNMTIPRFRMVFCVAFLLACVPAVGQIQVSGQITSNTTSCTTFVLPFRVEDAGWIIPKSAQNQSLHRRALGSFARTGRSQSAVSRWHAGA